MNNYIKVFAASVLSFMVVSCSLDEVNYSAESSEEYIKDETQYTCCKYFYIVIHNKHNLALKTKVQT